MTRQVLIRKATANRGMSGTKHGSPFYASSGGTTLERSTKEPIERTLAAFGHSVEIVDNRHYYDLPVIRSLSMAAAMGCVGQRWTALFACFFITCEFSDALAPWQQIKSADRISEGPV